MSLATLAGAAPRRPAFRRRQVRELMGLPKTLAAIGELDVRLATTKAEIRRAQKLRYRVFFEEGGAKADTTARLIRRDVCRFDRVCDHLIIVDNSVVRIDGKPTVVGACRLLRDDVAAANFGFYSAGEFDVASLIARHPGERLLELGRACVAPAYRSNKRAIELMWRGIWAYARHHRVDAIFGCASFPGAEPTAHAAALRFLRAAGGGDPSVGRRRGRGPRRRSRTGVRRAARRARRPARAAAADQGLLALGGEVRTAGGGRRRLRRDRRVHGDAGGRDRTALSRIFRLRPRCPARRLSRFGAPFPIRRKSSNQRRRVAAPAPVAQLDRALPSEGRGHRFESCRVRHKISDLAENYGIPSNIHQINARGQARTRRDFWGDSGVGADHLSTPPQTRSASALDTHSQCRRPQRVRRATNFRRRVEAATVRGFQRRPARRERQ